MTISSKFGTRGPFAAAALAVCLWAPALRADGGGPLPAGRIFGHYVGRAFTDNSGNFVVYGYYAYLDGIPGPFFNGSPGEGTAFFTFRSSPLVFPAVLVNGSILWAPQEAGATLSIYFNASPHGDWNNPDSFSSGQLIATFVRSQGFFICNGNITLGNTCSDVVSDKLLFSADFTFKGQKSNLGTLIPAGVSTFTPMLDQSFPGFAAVYVGYHVAMGKSSD